MRSIPSTARASTDFSASREEWNVCAEVFSCVASASIDDVKFSCSARWEESVSSVACNRASEDASEDCCGEGGFFWIEEPVALAVAVEGVVVGACDLFRRVDGCSCVGAGVASGVCEGSSVVVVVVVGAGRVLVGAVVAGSWSSVMVSRSFSSCSNCSSVVLPSSGVSRRSSPSRESSSSSSSD